MYHNGIQAYLRMANAVQNGSHIGRMYGPVQQLPLEIHTDVKEDRWSFGPSDGEREREG